MREEKKYIFQFGKSTQIDELKGPQCDEFPFNQQGNNPAPIKHTFIYRHIYKVKAIIC